MSDSRLQRRAGPEQPGHKAPNQPEEVDHRTEYHPIRRYRPADFGFAVGAVIYATPSPASPIIRSIGSPSCCPGTGGRPADAGRQAQSTRSASLSRPALPVPTRGWRGPPHAYHDDTIVLKDLFLKTDQLFPRPDKKSLSVTWLNGRPSRPDSHHGKQGQGNWPPDSGEFLCAEESRTCARR